MPDHRAARRTVWIVAGLVLLGGGVRLAAFEAARPVALLGDENYYLEVATRIARGEGHLYVGEAEGASAAWRPPAHAWLLSRFVAADAPEPERRERLQHVGLALGTLLVLLVALLGRALFDPTTGAIAAAVAALHPTLVAHSHYLWSETLFAMLVAAGLATAARARERPQLLATLAAGLAFGLATLTREIGAGVALASGAWWVWLAPQGERRRAGAHAAGLMFVTLLLALPWALRNEQHFGRWIGVSTVGWFAAAEGNTLEHPQWWLRSGPAQADFHRRYFSTRDELERLDLAREHALARIAAEQPAWLGKKLVRNGALLLNPDSVVRTKIRNGAYGDRPARAARWLLAASLPAWLGLATLAALGIAADGRSGRRLLAAGLLGAVLALHVATNATPRFRVPWLPLLCVYAAHALVLGRRLPGAVDRTGAVGAGLFLLFLFGVALPYYASFGGRP